MVRGGGETTLRAPFFDTCSNEAGQVEVEVTGDFFTFPESLSDLLD